MKNLKFSYFVIILCFLNGCTNNRDLLLTDEQNGIPQDIIVLRERDKSHPLTDYSTIRPKHTTTRADLSVNDFIGRGFKVEIYPFENAQNVGFPVINMEKFIAEKPNFYQSVPVKESFSKYESFYGFDRYENKINSTSIVTTGLALDFKIFKIGAQETIKNIFKCSDVQLDESVFGELGIKFYDRKYQLYIPSSSQKDIYRNYLCKDFTKELYYTTPDEIIQNYGGFVLTQFISGAQATALYCGQYIEYSHDKDLQRETNLNTEISASIGVKEGAKTRTRSESIEPYQGILIGRRPGSSMSTTKKFRNIKFSLRTLGGLPSYSQFTVPKDINSMVFDLSLWSKSLENTSNLTIADLPKGSLIPLSDFVEEDNLKEAFYDYYKKGSNAKISLIQEPHLEIRMVYYSNGAHSIWETNLITRYGEKIHLRSTFMFAGEMIYYVHEEADRVSALFPGLKVEADYLDFKKPNRPPGYNLQGKILDKENRFSTKGMRKFTDSTTGKIYLLTTVTENGKKLAYTLYDSNVINDYIFEDLINSLPVDKNATLKSIREEYYLIAL